MSHFFQIAYRTASNKFPGKLRELFLVLSDDYVLPDRAEGQDPGFKLVGRGQKHRLDDDQMSVGSQESKRHDAASFDEKNKAKGARGKPPHKSQSQSQNKPKK